MDVARELTPPASRSKLPHYSSSTTAFQRLSFAYKTLSKPETRRLYDLGGMQRMPDGGKKDSKGLGSCAGTLADNQSLNPGTRSAAADDENLNGLVWGVFDEVGIPLPDRGVVVPSAVMVDSLPLPYIMQFINGDFEMIRNAISQ